MMGSHVVNEGRALVIIANKWDKIPPAEVQLTLFDVSTSSCYLCECIVIAC
jgi:predicted GTPase